MSKNELEQVLKPGSVKPSEVKKNAAERVKKLEEESKAKDEELKDLKKKLANLAKLNESVQLVHKSVYAILGQFSPETSLLKRAQKVAEELTNLKKQWETNENKKAITPEITEKLKRLENWETIIGLMKERWELRKDLGIF